MIKHRIFIGVVMGLTGTLVLLLADGRSQVAERIVADIPAQRELVSNLQLTDLALWTEARYTRHPSQADFFTPFQDFPAAPEHFPAGSILAPARRKQLRQSP